MTCMSSMLPKPFSCALRMCLISCGSMPIMRQAVASVATVSVPAIMRFILTGVPFIGPEPSMPTKPSITVNAGLSTVFMSLTTLLMPFKWYLPLNFSGSKPNMFFMPKVTPVSLRFEFCSTDDCGFSDNSRNNNAL